MSCVVVRGVFARVSKLVIVAAVPLAFPVTLPVKFPENVPVVVPGNVGLFGMLRVQDPLVVIGLAPVTAIWLAVPNSPTLVTLPRP